MKTKHYTLLFKTVFLAVSLIILSSTSNAQEKIKLLLTHPMPDKMSTGDLWKLDVTNSSKDNIRIYLSGTASESQKGLIVTGKTKVFSVSPGTKRYTYEDFKSGEVSWKNKSIQDAIVRTGNVPEGNYTICVTAYFENGEIAAQENCIEQTVRQQGSISLISPSDGTEVDPSQPLIFNWTPIQGSSGYDLRIVEIKGSQSPDDAIKGPALFEKKGLSVTSYQYSISDPKFEDGKRYAWQVKSVEVVSSVFTYVNASMSTCGLTGLTGHIQISINNGTPITINDCKGSIPPIPASATVTISSSYVCNCTNCTQFFIGLRKYGAVTPWVQYHTAFASSMPVAFTIPTGMTTVTFGVGVRCPGNPCDSCNFSADVLPQLPVTDTCKVKSITINTGYNHNDNSLYNIGDNDQSWRLVAGGWSIATWVVPSSGWCTQYTNSQWISGQMSRVGPGTSYTYEFKFCLSNTNNVSINMSLRADNGASVSLNGNVIGATSGMFNFDCTHNLSISDNTVSHFVTGVNTLRVTVSNGVGSITGLNIEGTILGDGLRNVNCICN